MSTQTADQLRILLDDYFLAVGVNEPGRLPLVDDVRFTENTQRLELGEGLWATATAVVSGRAAWVADVTMGEVVGWGLVGEAGGDTLLAARLKAPEGGISEIETLVVRQRDLAGDLRLLNAEGLARPSPGFLEVVEPAERSSTAQLRQAADGYLDGVAGHRAELIPVADGCVRIENGVQTVLNPTGVGLPAGREPNAAMALGVAEQVRRGYTRHIAAARDRRSYLMDLERDLIFVSFLFDHIGGTPNVEGRVPFATSNSMQAFEVFKVVGGTIRHIEAAINILPYQTPTGW